MLLVWISAGACLHGILYPVEMVLTSGQNALWKLSRGSVLDMSHWEEASQRRSRTHWRDNISRLAWECLSAPLEELEEVAGEKEVLGSLLSLLPLQHMWLQSLVMNVENKWLNHVNTVHIALNYKLFTSITNWLAFKLDHSSTCQLFMRIMLLVSGCFTAC